MQTKWVNFSACPQCRRVGQVNVGGAHHKNEIGFMNVLVTESGDLLLETIRLVHGCNLYVAR